MAIAARQRLADILSTATPPVASSVHRKANTSVLRLEVDGIGRIQFPVPANQARDLCRLGQPARFGRGDETLTDPEVRDTWEIPKGLVRIEWNDAITIILDAVRDELGLPSSCELTADFNSMLVYEPGQFFVAHQDSEKHDTMIATLVVTLPSAHTGGELVVAHRGKSTVHRGSKSALSLAAFYADCRHEVRPVRSGHRISLTYNLLLKGDTDKPITGDEAAVGELARCLEEHFTTPVTDADRRAATDPPNRLVYLLDHEYTERGLSWSRLKEATPAGLLYRGGGPGGLRGRAGPRRHPGDLERLRTRTDAHALGRHRRRGSRGRGRPRRLEHQELIDSSIRLIRWIGPREAWSENISLAGLESVPSTTEPLNRSPNA